MHGIPRFWLTGALDFACSSRAMKRGRPARPLSSARTSTASGGRGPLFLPRVRPAHIPVADETWVALVDPSLRLTPISAHWLVWVVPEEPRGTAVSKQPGDVLRAELAWRWNDDNAEARVDREGLDEEPRVEIRSEARVAEDAQHIVIEGDILLEHGSRPLDVLPIWIDESASHEQQWSFHSRVDNASLAARPLDAAAEPLWPFPPRESCWAFRSARARGASVGSTSRAFDPGSLAGRFR